MTGMAMGDQSPTSLQRQRERRSFQDLTAISDRRAAATERLRSNVAQLRALGGVDLDAVARQYPGPEHPEVHMLIDFVRESYALVRDL